MGGFGALHLARLYPECFCATGAHSPALWASAGETAPGAFDDAEDFARHDLIAAAAAGAFDAQRIWLDAGSGDPFRSGRDAFVAVLRGRRVAVEAGFPEGDHDHDYGDPRWPAYLRFYAAALERCD